VSFIIALSAAREEPPFGSRSELDDAHQSTILFNGYSTIPCALAALSFGRICRTTASSTIGVNGHPIGVTQRRYRRLLERRQDSKNGRQIITMDVEQQTQPYSLRQIAPCSIRIQVFLLFRASGIGSCGQVHDEHRRGLQHGIDDAQSVRTQ